MFWGELSYGRINVIAKILFEDNENNTVKQLPLQENGEYGTLMLLTTEKLSEKCLDKLAEDYIVGMYDYTNGRQGQTEYNYLLILEPLRYTFVKTYHFADDALDKHTCGNRWDFEGYFYITDEYNSFAKIAIIPFTTSSGIESSHNLSEPEALEIVKKITKRLNDGAL